MKTYLFVLWWLMWLFPVAAQLPRTTHNINLAKVIPVQAFRGCEYEITVAVRQEKGTPFSGAGITVLQVGESNWDFIQDSRLYAVAAQELEGWQQLHIRGVIRSEAHKIWVYLSTAGDGEFYFDNIRCSVTDARNGRRELNVPNGDFEQSSRAYPFKGLENTKGALKLKGAALAIVADPLQEFHQVLKITVSGSREDTTVWYGYNAAVGNFVNSNGALIYYETYGNGPPLLLLHGNGGSIGVFSEVIPLLAQHYKVIAVDTRAQGRSTNGAVALTYELFAEDMKNLLDTLGCRDVNVVGWSDGGITGLLLAATYPSYVGTLVAMGANLNPSYTAVSSKVMQQARKDLARLKRKNDQRNTVTVQLLQLVLQEPDIKTETLQQISAKTLIMAGEKDLVKERHTRLIAASIPNADLLLLKGQTHWVVRDNPGLFARTVLDFLLNTNL